MFDSTVVRAHVSAAGAKGARRASARPFAWRLHHENPRKIGRLRRHHRLRPDRRRSFRRAHFETLLDIGPDIQPRAAISRQRLRQQGQPRSRQGRAASRRSSLTKSNEKDKPAFLARHPLQGTGPASSRASAGSSRFKPSRSRCRKDRQYETIPFNRQPSPRPLLGRIRPHGLVKTKSDASQARN